jgi:hypothetical protein
MTKKLVQNKSSHQVRDDSVINDDLFDHNTNTKSASPNNINSAPLLKRQISKCNIRANPHMPFGKFFNREMNYTKKIHRLSNGFMEDVFDQITMTRDKVIFK